MRIRQREQAYSIVQLKEYQPEYDSRMVYVQNRTVSSSAGSLYQIIPRPGRSSTAASSRSIPESSRRPRLRKLRRRRPGSTFCWKFRRGWRA